MTGKSRRAKSERVVVIGSAGFDIVGRLEKDAQPETSNPAVIRTTFGGIGRNVAENLARLGQPVSLITAVGTDVPGDQLLEFLSPCAVDLSGCLRTPLFPTGSYLAVISKDGSRHIALADMRVMATLTPEYILSQQKVIEQASLIFMDANLPPRTMRKILTIANHAHIPVCGDPASSILAVKLRPLLPHLRLVTPNYVEANILCQKKMIPATPESGQELARYLINLGVETAVIPMGSAGVCYATSETSGHVPAIETTVMDPTGAGDAFTSTLIYSMLNNISIDDAVRLGNQAASLTLGYPGSVLPDLSVEMLYSH